MESENETYVVTGKTKICPNCGAKIDVAMKFCPNCCKKQPNPKQKMIIIIAIAAVVIGIIGSATGAFDEPAQQEQKTAQTSTKETKVAEKKKEGKATPASTATPKPKKAVSKKDFMAACKSYSYKKLARYPDKYVGKKIKIQIQVAQIVEGGWFDDSKYYRCYTKGAYGTWFENEFFIVDKREDGTKILEKDILTVYGEFAGCEKVDRALTNTSDEVPSINMKYCTIKE